MFITIDLHIYKIQNAIYKYTEKSIKHCSFSDSIHGKGDMKPKFMDPNFCYTIENISFLRMQKTGNGAE